MKSEKCGESPQFFGFRRSGICSAVELNFVCGRKKFQLRTKNISSADEIQYHCAGTKVSLRWYKSSTAPVRPYQRAGISVVLCRVKTYGAGRLPKNVKLTHAGLRIALNSHKFSEISRSERTINTDFYVLTFFLKEKRRIRDLF